MRRLTYRNSLDVHLLSALAQQGTKAELGRFSISILEPRR